LECGAIISSPRDLSFDIHGFIENFPGVHSINLGHIHKRYISVTKDGAYITHVGSPYPTDFSEGGYPRGYMLIEESEEPTWINIEEGFSLLTTRWRQETGWTWDVPPKQYELEDAFVRIIIEAATPMEIHNSDYGAVEMRVLQAGACGFKTEIRSVGGFEAIEHEVPDLLDIDSSIRRRIEKQCVDDADEVVDLYERIKNGNLVYAN